MALVGDIMSKGWILALGLLLAGCQYMGSDTSAASASNRPADSSNLPAHAASASVRFATYNTSLNDDRDGGLIARLEAGDDKARKIAAVIQHQRPDVILLNEFDYDDAQRAAELFQHKYLEVPQFGQQPIRYEYRFLAPVNTGVASGMDLDHDGRIGGSGRQYGDDAFGYGLHPGQYGMLVLSRYPIDAAAARTFQKFLWKDLPGANAPVDPKTHASWYPPEVWKNLRLSSKSHWDVPIKTPMGEIHFLVDHPTPPVFDGPEDRNGARNFDEIRLWAEYISPGEKSWLCDDAGKCGGLASDARFVIAGDHNSDPIDGAGRPGAIEQLRDNPRVNASFMPRSEGAVLASKAQAGQNLVQHGNPAEDTGDFGPRIGNLHIDYVLPSQHLKAIDGGVFWPTPGQTGADWLDASDHRLVWLDIVGN
jgi:hypothetical protein